jgi:GPH family glycoside/pentoside/hexuronide:cation symporter
VREPRLKRSSLALFTAPCLPLSALGLPLSVYLPAYYSEQIGVPFAAVGMAFMLVRLVDMMFDPMIGGIMDRTRTRFGRFKPWMIVGAPILMLGIAMLFLVERGASAVYLWLALAVVYIGFSICQLSQVSWASTLSGDYNERSRIYSWWQIANIVGALVIVLLPVVLERLLGREHGESVRAMGVFLIALIPICVLLATVFVGEPRKAQPQSAPEFMEYVRVFRSAAVRRVVLADLMLATAIGVTGSLFFFFFRHAKGMSEADASVLILLYLVAALAGAPVWTRAAVRWGKHNALIIATFAFIAALAVVCLLLPASFGAMAAGLFILGLSNAAPQLLLRAMVADAADEERLETGRDNTGMLFGFITAVNKIGNALAVGVSFIFLGASGFAPGDGGAEGSLPLYAIYVGLPCLLAAAGVTFLWKYPLTPARHDEVRRLLAERDAAAPQLPSKGGPQAAGGEASGPAPA